MRNPDSDNYKRVTWTSMPMGQDWSGEVATAETVPAELADSEEGRETWAEVLSAFPDGQVPAALRWDLLLAARALIDYRYARGRRDLDEYADGAGLV